MAKPKLLGEQTSVHVLVEDVEKLDKLKQWETEPRWSVFQRAVKALADKESGKG